MKTTANGVTGSKRLISGPVAILLCAVAGSAILASTALAFRALSSNTLSQECVQAGTAKPTVNHKPTMYHAGIRPFTPGFPRKSEVVIGSLSYPAMPDGSTQPDGSTANCTPGFTRPASFQLQMQKPHERSEWRDLEAGKGVLANNPYGDQPIRARTFWFPIHAQPAWYFNQCVGGRGWLKIRDKITLEVQDAQTRQTLGQRTYIIPGSVHGTCQSARFSARVTKG